MHPIQTQASAGKGEETGNYRGDPREYPEGTPRMGLSRDRDRHVIVTPSPLKSVWMEGEAILP